MLIRKRFMRLLAKLIEAKDEQTIQALQARIYRKIDLLQFSSEAKIKDEQRVIRAVNAYCADPTDGNREAIIAILNEM